MFSLKDIPWVPEPNVGESGSNVKNPYYGVTSSASMPGGLTCFNKI